MPVDPVFERLQVSFLARGGATVYWSLRPHFLDPPPYAFQLQAGGTGNPAADDWADVGSPVVDVYLAVDPARRASGREWTTHYRVVLTTSLGTYTSLPAPAFGVLPPHQWRIAADIVRRATLKHALYAVPGWLLKRRATGTIPDPTAPATAATDPITGVVSRGRAATAGTPFLGGYYAAYPFAVDLAAQAHAVRPDPARGVVDDAGLVVPGTCVQVPRVASQDAFAAAGSDRRYYVAAVRDVAEWLGVPLVAECEFRLAPADDPLYTVPVPASPAPLFP